LLSSKTRRAEEGNGGVKEHLLLTRYSARRVATGEMMSVGDVKEILGIEILGVIPESQDVLSASNAGTPIILNDESDVATAYQDAVSRLLGNTVPLRFVDEQRKGFFARILGS
jgi:septum site-determining protein MinD